MTTTINTLAADACARARKRLAKRGAWTKGAYARDASGRVQGLYSHDATCWCLEGALFVETGFLGWNVRDAIRHALGGAHWATAFNDAQTSVWPVLAALARAERKLRGGT